MTNTNWLAQFEVLFNTLQRKRKSTFKPLLWSKHAACTVAVVTLAYGLIDHHTLFLCATDKHTHSIHNTFTHPSHINTQTVWSHLTYKAGPLCVVTIFTLKLLIFFPGDIADFTNVSKSSIECMFFFLNLSWILCDAMYTSTSKFGAHAEHRQDSLWSFSVNVRTTYSFSVCGIYHRSEILVWIQLQV